jgi:hypothetical protein
MFNFKEMIFSALLLTAITYQGACLNQMQSNEAMEGGIIENSLIYEVSNSTSQLTDDDFSLSIYYVTKFQHEYRNFGVLLPSFTLCEYNNTNNDLTLPLKLLKIVQSVALLAQNLSYIQLTYMGCYICLNSNTSQPCTNTLKNSSPSTSI